MSDLSMWFGTRGYMQWVPCPKVDSDMSKVGWQSQAQYLNGGTRIRSSVAAHKEYNLAWGLQERDNIRTITDYADGVYGDDLIYFVDHFAADKNVLPQYWATPALAAEDAPILTGTAKPSLVETDSNTNGYPRYSAVYYVLPSDPKKNIYVPIPPGYTAWVGFHGQKPDDSTAYVRVRQAIGATGYGTSTALTPLSNDTTVQVNANFNSSTTVHGIVLDLQGTGTLIMTALIVQLRKTSSEYGTTRTNLVTNPSMESVNAGSVVMRRNLCTNPNFETNTTGWLANGSGTVLSRDTSTFYAGTASLKVVAPGTSSAEGAYSSTVSPGGLIAGSLFSASAWVKAPAGVSLRITAASNGTGASNSSTDFVGTGSWQRVSALEATLGANLNPYAFIFTPTARAVTFYVDNVIIEMGATVGDYFDGNTTDALGYVYDWTSTVNGSISTAACAATTVRTNLVPNPSLETNILNIASSAGTGGTNALTRETSGGWTGTSFARATWSVGTTAISGNMENVTSATTTVGATYTGSAYVRVNSAQRLVLQATGTSVGTNTATAVDVPANTWTRLSYTQANVTTAGTLNIRVGVSGGRNWVAGDTLDVDGWLLEASSTLGDYFDGSFPPADDFSYAWTGTANASTSIQRGAAVTNAIAAGGGIPVQSSSWYSTGSKSLRLIPTLDSTNGANTRIDVTTVVGATYTVQVKCRLSAALTGTLSANSRKVLVYDATSVTLLGTSNQAPNTAGTTLLTATFTATTTTTQIRLFNGAYAGNGDVWWDDLLVVRGTYTDDYFDGSTAGYGNVTYGWTNSALPNASTSYQYVTPTTGGYISGQGHSGCKFAEQPKLQNYSSAMDKSALTAKLVEVGAWA